MLAAVPTEVTHGIQSRFSLLAATLPKHTRLIQKYVHASVYAKDWGFIHIVISVLLTGSSSIYHKEKTMIAFPITKANSTVKGNNPRAKQSMDKKT